MSCSQDIEAVFRSAAVELACERCGNGYGVMVRGELGECPECHGDHRFPATIHLLRLLLLKLGDIDMRLTNVTEPLS